MARNAIYLPDLGMSDSTQRHLVPDAVVVGDMLFSGGIAGFDPKTGQLPESNEAQAALVYERIAAVLELSGFSSNEIGHWFVWARDRHTKISAVNPLWEQWFPDIGNRPARHALARQLDPGQHYRIEVIGAKGAHRQSHEVHPNIFHTGGTSTKAFIPFGTTAGDYLFTGPTYGMYPSNRKMGETRYRQAELCHENNMLLYSMTGFTPENLAQMFVWYHDADSKTAAVQFTAALFPDPQDRPAVHYIYSQLPYWAAVEAQFLIQYDIIGLRGGKRTVINVPGVQPLDGSGDAVPAGVSMGNLCFSSVCIGQDPKTGELADSLERQTELAFNNARAVVEAGGFSPEDIGHVYVWYPDHSARETVDKVWARVFPKPEDRPARHSLPADLPDGVLVGVEVTAAR